MCVGVGVGVGTRCTILETFWWLVRGYGEGGFDLSITKGDENGLIFIYTGMVSMGKANVPISASVFTMEANQTTGSCLPIEVIPDEAIDILQRLCTSFFHGEAMLTMNRDGNHLCQPQRDLGPLQDVFPRAGMRLCSRGAETSESM